ncbi:MAG: YafY family transcriptional regulator [Desulfobulbaceae bacterium]|nr:MAG: YafY family transcriptional regulator [Desulfobulbaceae bacterium]
MSDGLRYERYVWVHGHIKACRFPNSRHLCDEFEVSDRTARRDIEFMRLNLRAPLAYDYCRKGYFYTDAAYELPPHWISETNVLSLALAVRLASTIPEPSLKEDLCRLIDRVTGLGGRTGRSCLQRLPEKISVKNIEYARVDTAVFRRTVEALFDERTVSITYQSPHSDAVSTRIIRPLHLMHYMGSWYLLAWCGIRQALRDFALARIRTISPVNQPIALPVNLPDIRNYTRRHFGIMQGDRTTRVILRFSPKISSLVAEQIWHPEQILSGETDGSLLLQFPVADFRELTRVILSHGAEVEIVEQLDLKMAVREEIRRMMKNYDW